MHIPARDGVEEANLKSWEKVPEYGRQCDGFKRADREVREHESPAAYIRKFGSQTNKHKT